MPSEPFKVVVDTVPRRIISFSKRRTVIHMFNESTQIIFLGVSSSVTTATGFPIPPNMGITLAREYGDDPMIEYFAIVSTGTATLRVWEGFGETIGTKLEKVAEVLKK